MAEKEDILHGSLNYIELPVLGESNTIEIYGNFEGFPL